MKKVKRTERKTANNKNRCGNIVNKGNGGRKLRNRIISMALTAALITGSVPMQELSGTIKLPGFSSLSEKFTGTLSALLPNWWDNKSAVYAEGFTDPWEGINSITFNDINDLINYSIYYQTYSEFASDHKEDTLTIALTGSNKELSTNYQGIGTAVYPFEGTVKLSSSGSYSLQAYRAFFAYLSDKATITDGNGDSVYMSLTRLSSVGDSESAPLFADHVVHDNSVISAAGWKVEIVGSNTFSGAIGEIGANAIVKLDFKNTANTNVAANAAYDAEDTSALTDAGLFAGSIGANAQYTVIYTGNVNTEVKSANGNAGAFVGTMGANSTLTVVTSLTSISPTVKASGTEENIKGYAGGLVGKLDSTATVQRQTITTDDNNQSVATYESLWKSLSIGGTVTGTTGAGGLYGYYELQDTAGDGTVPAIDLKDYTVTARSYAKYCGGLLGVLYTTGDVSITNTADSAKAYTSGLGSAYETTGYYGGVAGRFITSALTNTATLTSLEISPTASAKFNAYGGTFGIVDSTAYVKADSVNVTATGTNKRTDSPSFFGGLVGATSSEKGVFIDLGDFTLDTGSESYQGGGVVGQFYNGVLRLSGTTDMSDALCASGDDCGQLVGNNDNVLVYALGTGTNGTAYGSGWTFKRSNGSTADDLGTWGEVVRISGVETNIVIADLSVHTVTLQGLTADTTDSDYKIANQNALVKTALNIQLNNGTGYDCLLFASGGATSSTLLGAKLTLTADVSFAGTGVTGLMRDGGDVTTLGSFAGTICGLKGTNETYKITLATGELYGLDKDGAVVTSSSTGAGQIYRHQHTGLFSVLAGTVSNLTVDGSINVRNCVDGMNIGGIASRNGGDITLSKVIAKGKIYYNEATKIEGSETTGKNIGGLIGFVGTNGTVTIKSECVVGEGDSTKPDIILSGSHESWNAYGGVIGKVTASVFTIDIGEENSSTTGLTVKTCVNISGLTAVASNSDCGGLIGHIIKAGSYGSRTVNIYKLDFNRCSIGNAASTNGGGLLGYSWLNTTANIKGMTVTSATINNCTTSGTAGGNANVGAMCYVATGKWVVDSLTVTSLSMPSGGDTSFGMLVNKAYTYGKDSYTGGLYLDVLNSGYTISAATLPGVTRKYDEIAAYTAKDAAGILTGGAGVVSINMNNPRAGALVDSVNDPNVRIADYTVGTTTTTGTGTYSNKLSSFSSIVNDTSRYYYNLDLMSSSDNAQNIMLWSVNKYAYTDIAGEFSTTLATTLSGAADMTGLSFYPVALADGITISDLTLKLDYAGIYAKTGATMDPGAVDQHYLMHSGLFLNSTAGQTLTISGALSLNGNFLEVGKYNGVLISDTMRGNLTCTSGSIVLNGIVAKTTANVDYSSGYALINNIKRADSTVAIPELKLYNVRTGTYSADSYFKSLIGPAVGPGLKMTFSKIKLDGAASTSIFRESTLVNSIKTDQNAQLIYNFTWDNDWGDANNDSQADRNVTYGKELSDSTHSGSVEYANKETKYSSGTGTEKHRWYVNPTDNSSLSGAVDFSSYRPYVYQAYNNTPDTNGYYFREIMVNVEEEGLTIGCGTYNDPYQISTADQLKILAAFLQNNN